MAILLLALCPLCGWGETAPQPLVSGPFRIEYGPRDDTVARDSLAILEEGLAEFEEKLPPGNEPVSVIICGSYQEFSKRAGAYGKGLVGGVADAARGTIVVKAPYLLPPEQDYRGMLRHELLHVLLSRNTDPANVPRWFDEGVAMVLSKELRWESAMRIARMYVRRQVIPYFQLDLAFAPYGDEAVFGDAYAEALSLTRFLRDRMGEARFWELIGALKHSDFNAALMSYAGLTPGGLYAAWLRSLWKVALISSLVSGFGVFQLMAVLVVVAYWRKRKRGRRLLREWDEEEEAGEGTFLPWEETPDSWEPDEEEDSK